MGWPGGLAPPRTRVTTWRLDCFGFGHIGSARGWVPSHAGEDSNPDLIVLETTALPLSYRHRAALTGGAGVPGAHPGRGWRRRVRTSNLPGQSRTCCRLHHSPSVRQAGIKDAPQFARKRSGIRRLWPALLPACRGCSTKLSHVQMVWLPGAAPGTSRAQTGCSPDELEPGSLLRAEGGTRTRTPFVGTRLSTWRVYRSTTSALTVGRADQSLLGVPTPATAGTSGGYAPAQEAHETVTGQPWCGRRDLHSHAPEGTSF